MPTLRRSKSLNDKLGRQKNRTGDIVRDPRSRDVEGRTRQNVDNFQALLHVKKQTEDRARQLDLALSYASNGGITRPRGPTGGVELPYPIINCLPETPEDDIDIDSPVQYRRRQRSADGRNSDTSHRFQDIHRNDGRPGSVVTHQHQLLHQELQQRHQKQRLQPQQHPSLQHSQHPSLQHSQHPSLQHSQHPSLQHNQHPSLQHNQHQRSFSGVQSRSGSQRGQQQRHRERPVSMIEPRLAHNFIPSQEELARKDQVIQSLTDSQRNLNKQNHMLLSKIDELEFQVSQLREVLKAHNISEGTTLPSRRSRPSNLQGDIIRASLTTDGRQPSAAVSPNSDHSVSGYGSLAGSACDGGVGPGVKVERVTDGYDEESLKLSVYSLALDSQTDTLARSSSSGGSSSRGHTMSRDSDTELPERIDQVHGGHLEKDGSRGSRLQEVERQLQEVMTQRDNILQRYKHLVDLNQQLMKRDELIEIALRSLLDKHCKDLQPAVKAELASLQDHLCDLEHDIRNSLHSVLKALSPQDSQRIKLTGQLDKDVAATLDRIVDLIGPEYMKLGRRLGVLQQNLEKIETSHGALPSRTRMVLESWLDGTVGGAPHSHPVHELVTALKDIDKDVNLLKQSPISGPERQALRNCLQYALDHVNDPLTVLDHLIVLNELTPGGIAFVQEVRQFPNRVLCRLWHVAEYRTTGIVSRLAVALQRASLPHVAHKLTDELEMQNSRLHSQSHAAPVNFKPPYTAQGHAQGHHPVHLQGQSQKLRPITRLPRPRSKVLESYTIPEIEKGDIWNKQSKNNSPSKSSSNQRNSPASLDNNRISEV